MLAFYLTGGLLSFVFSPKAYAHPHIFITQSVKAVFDDKGLSTLEFHWELDEMSAGMLIEEFDLDKNKKFDVKETEVIEKNIFSYLSIELEEPFCFILFDDKLLDLTSIDNMHAIIKNHALVLDFTVPVHMLADDQYKEISVAMYDPAYYTVILLDEKRPLVIEASNSYDIRTPSKKDFKESIFYDMKSEWFKILQFRRKP